MKAPLRTVCIFTKESSASLAIAKRCVESGIQFGINVELYRSTYYKDMTDVHKRYGLHMKYNPIAGSEADFEAGTMPRSRIANGTTHYTLYRLAVETDTAFHILEHDAYFVGKPPDPIYDGVIQTSSHTTNQMTYKKLYASRRGQRQRQFEPKCDQSWTVKSGVIPHPLSGTNGTSGYIIGPGAAKRMIEYIEADGIANADRIRKEHVGDVFLQVPQSVFCDHGVKSHRL